jgi:hypothetical protein
MVSFGTFAHATARTIFAPSLAMPPRSALEPTMYPAQWSRSMQEATGRILTCYVDQENERYATLSAELYKVGRLEGRVGEQDPVICDNTTLVPMDVCKTL